MPSSQWDEALAAKYRSFQYHFPGRPLEGVCSYSREGRQEPVDE